MKLDLLAMAAHPDDVELTCGGTLIKMARRGYAVGIMDLTEGEMGTRGSIEIRRKEAAAAARLLGVDSIARTWACPTRIWRCAWSTSWRSRTYPGHCGRTTVILPYWEGRHPDHYTAARLGLRRLLPGRAEAARPRRASPIRPFKDLYSTTYDRSVLALVRGGHHARIRAASTVQSWPTHRNSRRSRVNGARKSLAARPTRATSTAGRAILRRDGWSSNTPNHSC